MPFALANTRLSGRVKGPKCKKGDSRSALCSMKRLQALGDLPFQTKGAYNDSGIAKMRMLIALVIPAILLAGLVLLRSSDTDISVADVGNRDDQMIANQSETSNCSASFTLATMTKGIPSG